MKNFILSFLRDEDGLTTVEYAVAGGLIALAVVVAFRTLGGTVGGVITQSTTWTLANSPYTVTSNVTVQNGATLTVKG